MYLLIIEERRVIFLEDTCVFLYYLLFFIDYEIFSIFSYSYNSSKLPSE